MKRIIISMLLALVAVEAKADTCSQNLMPLFTAAQAAEICGAFSAGTVGVLANNTYAVGRDAANSANINTWKIDSSDNTVINSSASDDLILQLEDDANRLISFDAPSDTALAMTYGDGSTASNFSINGNTGAGSLTLGSGDAAGADVFIKALDDIVFRTNNITRVEIDGSTGAFEWFNPSGNLMWSLTSSGNLNQNSTNGGDLVFGKTTGVIRQSTTDGTDNRAININAGDAVNSTARSGYVGIFGNEYTSIGGSVEIGGGNVATGNIQLNTEHASAGVIIGDTTRGALWTFSNNGTLNQNSTNGGDLVFSRAGYGVRYPAVTIMTPSTNSTPAAGSSVTGIISAVATAMPTANSFISLPAATPHIGKNFVVYNQSAHPLKLVPATGDSVLPAAAITPFTCATGLRCDCLVMDGTSWVCE